MSIVKNSASTPLPLPRKTNNSSQFSMKSQTFCSTDSSINLISTPYLPHKSKRLYKHLKHPTSAPIDFWKSIKIKMNKSTIYHSSLFRNSSSPRRIRIRPNIPDLWARSFNSFEKPWWRKLPRWSSTSWTGSRKKRIFKRQVPLKLPINTKIRLFYWKRSLRGRRQNTMHCMTTRGTWLMKAKTI